MTSRPILELGLPESDCDVEDCPQYCRQWSRKECLAAEDADLSCGLCQLDGGFMQPHQCYACVLKEQR